jgi:hypothetical protein
MANVLCNLEEQLSDLRSNEIAYRFTAENRGPKTIRLRSLTPQVADGVALLEVRDTEERAVLLEHRILCDELTATLRSHIARMDSKGDKKSPFAQIFAPTSGTDAQRAIDFAIKVSSDADTALTTWFVDTPAKDSSERKLFEAKLTQLKRYEDELTKQGPTQDAIATVPSGSAFSRTYVFQFARGTWDSRKYNLIIEAAYADDDPNAVVENGAASASATISPPPLVLTAVAIFAALLGVVLKDALKLASSSAPRATQTIATAGQQVGEQLVTSLISLDSVAAMIIALVFFNIYEHTELGSRVKFGVGWRSALLIGVLAGLFTERLLKALTVFVGFSQTG